MKTTTTWKTAHRFDSVQNGAKIEIDAKGGFGPKSLLLSGLAGCTAEDVEENLEKILVTNADFINQAYAEQTNDPPRVFKTIHLTYHIKAEEEAREKIKKAIDLSLEKYCGVAAMLKKNSDIQYRLLISAE